MAPTVHNALPPRSGLVQHEIYGPVCVVVTAEHSRLESALALQAAFTDINIHKSRSVYYWLN